MIGLSFLLLLALYFPQLCKFQFNVVTEDKVLLCGMCHEKFLFRSIYDDTIISYMNVTKNCSSRHPRTKWKSFNPDLNRSGMF